MTQVLDGAREQGGDLEFLNLFKSHKEFKGGKITAIVRDADDKRFLVFGENGGGRWMVTDDWFEKHKPERGGYLVLYRDGYISYSPAEAFEDGNNRVSMNDKELKTSYDIMALCASRGMTLAEVDNTMQHVHLRLQEQERVSRAAVELKSVEDFKS